MIYVDDAIIWHENLLKKKLPDYLTESKFIKNNFHHNKKIVNLLNRN